ncbi:MAG TPA: SDR family oxidoreductase [Phototrophicaceae bacterium]|nr:SDR family oxidoreductase [Phototrophicaceae bacterium]
MFKDQIFLVTGGANGIGLATARALKKRGAKLALWDVDAVALQTVSSELDAVTAVVDVTRSETIQTGLQALVEHYGRLDGVIHCAGIARGGLFEEVPLEQHRRVIEINLFGTIAVTQLVLPLLRRSKGSLVLISSVSAFYGPPGFSSYAATKAGVLNFAQLMQVELTGSGVHIGVICPHFVDTALYQLESRKSALTKGSSPLLELRTPDQIAVSILRGIERRKFMIWAGWKARLIYLMTRYLDFAGYRVMLMTWRRAQKE